ncbi:hypothetical protein [Thalassotalea marina]|uniref:Uncharacterized protein n=1 Tax=Thalassotalea marina TaxID=1673741 RepID=A0A919BPH0_9GAMM|nr:hypothetical protein [Thalassotalea marina]GHG03724.1 hypothetical protein GCM10017161_36250 [Thalassotalea marina]
MRELTATERREVDGGHPMLVVWVVYTITMPVFAAGVAVGASE